MDLRPCLLAFFACCSFLPAASGQTQLQDWPWYGDDAGGNRYSALTDINRANVSGLKLAWEWKPGEKPMPERGVTPGNFEATPLMIDGVLYISTAYKPGGGVGSRYGAAALGVRSQGI